MEKPFTTSARHMSLLPINTLCKIRGRYPLKHLREPLIKHGSVFLIDHIGYMSLFKPPISSTRNGKCYAKGIQVEFLVPETPLEFGQSFKVVGSTTPLGNWDAASSAAVLQWHEGNNWNGTVELDAKSQVEFKLVKVAGGEIIAWEEGNNRQLALDRTPCKVACHWEGDQLITLKVDEQSKSESKTSAERARLKAEQVKKKSLALEKKVACLEEKLKKSSTKLHSIRKNQEEEEKEALFHESSSPSPSSQSTEQHQSKIGTTSPSASPSPSIIIPPEMVDIVSSVSQGVDGTLTFVFNSDFNDAVINDAASLAKRLKRQP